MKRWIPFLLLTIVFVSAYAYCFDAKLDLNGDNASYIQLARTLAAGHGYANPSPAGFTPASHFPPGYPFFLSLFMRIGIDNLLFFKIVNGLLLWASLLALFALSQKLSDRIETAFTAVLLACLSPHLMHFASMAMSEMLYLFCVTAAFVSLSFHAREKEKPFYCSPLFYTALLAAGAAYYIRAVGMSVLFAVLLFFLFRKEWKAAVSAAAGMVLMLLPWSLRNAAYGIESRYFGTIMTVNPWRPELGTVSSFGEMVSKMVTNFDETVIKGFREILFPFVSTNYQEPSGFFGVIAGLLVLAVVFYGCWSLGGRHFRFPFLGFLLANIALLALWHGGNGSRYVVPVAPFLFLFFYFGLCRLLRQIAATLFQRKKRSSVSARWTYLLLLVAFPMLTSLSAHAKEVRQPFPPAYRCYFELAKAMEKQLPAGAVVSCRKPELFAYFAPSHFPVRYLFSVNPDEVVADMVRRKVDYVILEQLGYSSTPLYLYPAIQKYPELFPVISHISSPDTYLLGFDRAAAVGKFSDGRE